MHEVQVKFDIESRCPCRLSILSKSLTGNMVGGQKEEMGNMTPSLQPASNGETDGSRVIKEESPDSVHPLSKQGPKGTVQTSTLCELLTSTAIKLCLGQNGVRMAFAPVSPALPSDNRITNILDSIIAQVVERKIQEKHSECELRSPSPPELQVSHCILAPGGLLWLHDPNHSCNYRLFQEHWRQGEARSSLVTSASPVLPPPAACLGFRAAEDTEEKPVGARVILPRTAWAGGAGGEPAKPAGLDKDQQQGLLGRLCLQCQMPGDREQWGEPAQAGERLWGHANVQG